MGVATATTWQYARRRPAAAEIAAADRMATSGIFRAAEIRARRSPRKAAGQ